MFLSVLFFPQGFPTLRASEPKPKKATVETETNNTTDNTGISFAERKKQAMQPNGFALFTYMDVPDEQEEEYLKIESEWKQIHERMTEQGKLAGWGVAKARDNQLGVRYITWKSFPSLEALDDPYDVEDLKKWLGTEEFESLVKRTKESRKIVGEELLRNEDYTIDNLTRDTEQESNRLSFFLAYMTPKPGKESQYVKMEKDFFQKGHQNQVDHNPNFLGWRFEKRIFSWGELPPADYRTVSIFTREKTALTSEQSTKLLESKPERPDDLADTKIGDLRTMRGLVFDVIMTTDKKRSAVVNAWEELSGTWTHMRENGSRRVKEISPFLETLKFYDSEGNLKSENTSPMRIYIKDGIKHFSTYHPNVTWNTIYEIHDGKWYEQMRGIYHRTDSDPNQFIIYERVDLSDELSENQGVIEIDIASEARGEGNRGKILDRARRIIRARRIGD